VRTRPLPERKTLGTGWNIRPDTERVPVTTLREGDVVLEQFEHPVLIIRLTYPANRVAVYGRYIWQRASEPSWILGNFHKTRKLDRALPGEY
jgi:hypothetical protein